MEAARQAAALRAVEASEVEAWASAGLAARWEAMAGAVARLKDHEAAAQEQVVLEEAALEAVEVPKAVAAQAGVATVAVGVAVVLREAVPQGGGG